MWKQFCRKQKTTNKIYGRKRIIILKRIYTEDETQKHIHWVLKEAKQRIEKEDDDDNDEDFDQINDIILFHFEFDNDDDDDDRWIWNS